MEPRVKSGEIEDGAIMNVDINASAAIAVSKLAASASTIVGQKDAGGVVAMTPTETKVVLSLDNVTNVAQMPSSYLDTDTTLAADSDTKVASQKAVKAYVNNKVTKTVQVQVLADTVDVDTTSGIGYFYIPASMNGWVLTRATAFVVTAGTTNATTIQVRNLTKYASNDALSTAISIASAGTIATAGTVNTSYDDVSTDDRIKIYVTANSTTKAKGLYVVLEWGIS